jgi:hypothetical protein
VDVGVALTLRQGLAQDVVARIVPAHIEFGVKNERIYEAEGEREERRNFETLHGANLGNWLVGSLAEIGSLALCASRQGVAQINSLKLQILVKIC